MIASSSRFGHDGSMEDDQQNPKVNPLSPEEAARLILRPARPRARAMGRPSKALRKILRPMGKKFGAGVQELKMRWPEIAGPRLASVSTPDRLSGSAGQQTLTVITRGGAAMLVEAQSAQLLQRINLVVGGERVRKIRTRQGRIAGPRQQTTGPKLQRSCKPEQLAALDAQLADISDPALKTALRELGRGILAKGPRS
jgi:hypothetical protein